MIFSELYSAYYNAVAGIISCVIQGETEEKVLQQVVLQHAFSESVLTIIPSLKNEKWQLLRKDMSSPIHNIPSMPLTKLEKSWLKAISLDSRIRLFDLSFDGLENVEPLFTQEDFYLYDQYADGDPYSDEGYIKRFRMILTAIREKTPLKIEMENRKGSLIQMNVLPQRLEYSEKDDKFRLISSGCRYGGTVNLARIVTCSRYNGDNFYCPQIGCVRRFGERWTDREVEYCCSNCSQVIPCSDSPIVCYNIANVPNFGDYSGTKKVSAKKRCTYDSYKPNMWCSEYETLIGSTCYSCDRGGYLSETTCYYSGTCTVYSYKFSYEYYSYS